MIAGYSWPWLSSPKQTPLPDPSVTDIDLDGLKFKWNSTDKDWINSPNAFDEIGCIHTTQGYDLNYAAVIFGKEIDYDFKTQTLMHDFSDGIVEEGRNELKLEVTDNLGNSTIFETHFFRSQKP